MYQLQIVFVRIHIYIKFVDEELGWFGIYSLPDRSGLLLQFISLFVEDFCKMFGFLRIFTLYVVIDEFL